MFHNLIILPQTHPWGFWSAIAMTMVVTGVVLECGRHGMKLGELGFWAMVVLIELIVEWESFGHDLIHLTSN